MIKLNKIYKNWNKIKKYQNWVETTKQDRKLMNVYFNLELYYKFVHLEFQPT